MKIELQYGKVGAKAVARRLGVLAADVLAGRVTQLAMRWGKDGELKLTYEVGDASTAADAAKEIEGAES